MIMQRCVRQKRADVGDDPPDTASSGLVQFTNAALVMPDGLVTGELWMDPESRTIVDPQDRFWQRSDTPQKHRILDCHGLLLCPGMIDVMLFGAVGITFSSLGAEGTPAALEASEAMRRVCARLPELGITAFCPAIRAYELPAADVHRLLERLAPSSSPDDQPGARVLGVHLDGPFFGREYAPESTAPSHLKERLDGAALREALGPRGCEAVKVITLAPELPGAIEATKKLASEGVVVGLGRTGAGLARCEEAVRAGARLISHVYSHMPPFHHRDPGPIGLLGERGPEGSACGPHEPTEPTVPPGGNGGNGGNGNGGAHDTNAAAGNGGATFYSLAVAGQHKFTINLAHSTHPAGLVLLSCRRSLIFSEEAGEHKDDDDEEEDELAPLDGTLLSCARRLWHCSGSADPAAALLCGSAHPASLLGLAPAKGTLLPGADADLLLLDPDSLEVRACYVRGKLTWADEARHGAFWYH